MIENLQDELSQLEIKESNDSKLCAEKCKCFFKVLEKQNVQNQTTLNCTLMIINQNILAILRAFSNLKIIW